MSKTDPDAALLRDLTSGIASAYVANNHVPLDDLPSLVTTIHGALSGLGTAAGPTPAADVAEPPTPAQIRRSITPNALISFVDGRPYKTLKRHLSTHGLDPVGYRQRYGLQADYPMVCPEYSAKRSELARSAGLGRRREAAREPMPAAKGKLRAARQAGE